MNIQFIPPTVPGIVQPIKLKMIIFFIIAFVLTGCNSRTLTRDDKLSQNPELKKAIDFYNAPKDSLKKKAVLFLIDNMDYKSGLDSTIAETFTPCNKYLFRTHKDDLPRRVKDSIQNLYNERILLNDHIYVSDLSTMTADLLIENVEYAFKALDFPWAKHVPFETFCEYILPYRVQNEPLSRWRKELFLAYKPLMDSLQEKGVGDPKEVCKVISNRISKTFSFHDILIPNVAIEDLQKVPTGECIQRYILVTATARVFGLPMALDFVRQYPRWPGSHYWTTLVNDGQNKIMAFNGGETWELNPFKGLKMYRHTFRNYPNESVLEFFNNPNNLDVTNQYPYKVRDLNITLDGTYADQPIYLVAFGIGSELVPIDKGVLKDNIAKFKNVSYAEEAIVLPAIIEDGKLRLLGNPVSIWADESTRVFQPEKDTSRKVRCTAKYPVTWPMSLFAEQIVGAKIQGAHKPDFSDTVTVFTIHELPWYFQHFKVTTTEYPHYRYIPKRGTSVNLAEFHFYVKSKNDSACLENADTIKSPFVNNQDIKNLSDWNIRTNLNMQADQWFSLDVSKTKTKCLCEIAILTRNDYNVIEQGHLYELLYYDNGWVSVAKKTATDFFIEFDGVPAGTIMILKDLSMGKQERIFEYKDNRQIFW